MNKKKIILLGADILLLAVLIFLDQLTKHFAVVYLKDQMPIFIFIAVVILAVIVYVLIKTPNQRKYTKLHIALVCIAGGAIGNMIDRLKLDYVVDFLYFSLINFPIFNVADIYVTLSAIYLVILLLFVYKESDLEFLSFRTKKFRDVK